MMYCSYNLYANISFDMNHNTYVHELYSNILYINLDKLMNMFIDYCSHILRCHYCTHYCRHNTEATICEQYEIPNSYGVISDDKVNTGPVQDEKNGESSESMIAESGVYTSII